LGGTAFASKPTIAVLGLEVKDDAGTPTPQDTEVAKKFTEGLRGRAKLGTGPYITAGNSDKELIDEKLLKNCDTEAEKCMAQIGSDLGADFLMYGRIEKKGNTYTITMKLLDVRAKHMVKTSPDVITLADAANDVKLTERAQQIYAKLTGEKTTGTLVV
jgi:TolB-like protein